jgi:fibronectin type 3 domain-containing protein/regulation of enolase protein 1 (concanavalin A-like superfamily)
MARSHRSQQSRRTSILNSALRSTLLESLERRQYWAAHIVGNATNFASIQAAVDAASAGATITVDPGTYSESVVIGKTVTLKGAKAGIDGRSNARASGTGESIVNGLLNVDTTRGYSFKILANDVTIDGFTVQGQTSQSNATAAGIVMNPNIAGSQILNNIVQDNVAGLYLSNNSTTKAALIKGNVFRNNNVDGPNTGRGIYTDGGVSGGLLQNVSIDGNFFYNNLGQPDFAVQAAIGLEAQTLGAQTNIQIINNVFDTNGKAVLAIALSNSLIQGNVVGNHFDTSSGALRFEGGDQNITIQNNNLYGDGGRAIRIDQKAIPQDNFGFVITGNNIYENGLEADAENTGLMTNTLQYQGSLTATNNYWGAANGPSGLGTGSGDAILNEGTNIVFSPFAATYVINPQVPWFGVAQDVTSPMQVEDFDHGLEGISFHDTSGTSNSGVSYRPNQGVDIFSTGDTVGGNYDVVGKATEWIEYSVNVAVGGTYAGLFRLQNANAGGKFHVEANTGAGGAFVALTGTQTIVGTTWQTMSVPGVSLTSGQYILRLVFDTNASNGQVANFNWMQFNLTSALTPTAPTNAVATTVTSTSVSLTWQDNSNNETGFIIERMTGSTNVWNPITTTAQNITTYTDTTALASTNYTYRVRATNANGASTNAVSNAVTTPAGNLVYVSDLTWVGTPANGWGPVEKDKSNGGQAAGDGNTITLNTVTYTKGLGVHATSDITYTLNGAYSTFQSDVGVDDETGAASGLFFRVYGDGVVLFDSLGMTQASATKSINVSVAGVTTLRLFVDDLDGDYSFDHGDWANARLTLPSTPAAPTGLTATPFSGTQINLAWTDVTGETGYKVLRSTDNVTFAQVGSNLAVNSVSYNDTSVSGTTLYYYKVVATSGGGDSPASNVASSQPLQKPAAPSGLAATPFSATQINLAWTDVTGETGYKVLRSTDNVTFAQVGVTLAANAISYNDTGVTGTTLYYYRIVANNGAGDSLPSNTVSSQPLQPPAAPAGLTATAFSTTQINLAWTDVAGETSYKVYRSSDNITFGLLGSTAVNVTTYSDTTASGTTLWYYKVIANNSAGDSPGSNVASSKVVQPPAAPTNLVANALTPSQINLSWTDVVGETGYKIERSLTSASGFAQIGTAAANATSYSDMTVAGSTQYYYRIRANNTAGDSGYSNTAGASTPTGPTVPSVPGNLTATAASSSQINLSWIDTSSNETGFKIERSLNGTTGWTLMGTVAANINSYSDSNGLAPSTQYFYRVRATNLVGDSANSNVANATTTAAAVSTSQTYIATGSVWKYLDNGTNQGTAWRATSFTDTTWASGAAQLGYGDGDEATVVSYGSNANTKYVTTYFRKSFTVADATQVTALALRLLRDDGAVVYLNGTEIYRSNMPTGTISSTTLASTAVEDTTFYSSAVSPALLVTGTNVIAVEIHQADRTSSDISFDFELKATLSGANPTAPAAPSSLVATAFSSTQINLTWLDNASNETGFILERSPDGSTGWTQIATPAQNATSYSDTGRTASTQYFYRIRATNGVGPSANSNVANATTPAAPGLPSPWVNGDIGSTGATGSSTYASGTFTVKGSGVDIWGTADSFQFMYQPWSGNGQIIAKVDSIQLTENYAQAGVMFRDSLTANAQEASMVVTAQTSHEIGFVRRTSTGGTSSVTTTTGGFLWIKLIRNGTTITGYKSTDGTNWTSVGSATFSMGTNIYVGLCVTSRVPGTLCTATFSNVSTSTSTALAGAQPQPLMAQPTTTATALKTNSSDKKAVLA